MTTIANAPQSRLPRLLGFLEQDPENPALLADAIGSALDAGAVETAQTLLARYRAVEGSTPLGRNLEALIALAAGRPVEAATLFEGLLTQSPNDPVLRFNLASCKAMLGSPLAASELIDEAVVAQIPAAATLHVQVLHRLDCFEEALAHGLGYAERYPDDTALMGVLSVIAMDSDDRALALSYAHRAGTRDPEGLTTLGALSLDESKIGEAAALFEQALALDPDNPRALFGLGLGRLAAGEPAGAAEPLRRAAEQFGDYTSAWIAAGWADLGRGELARARKAFERALIIGEAPADAHGALAVVELCAAGQGAREHAEEALRLDPASPAARLAVGLLQAADGDPAGLDKAGETALNTPVGPNGETLAQTLIGLNAKRAPKL